MTTIIEDIRARRIWDSRGRPTVEVDVRLTSGVRGRGVAPAGASRGSNEAIDLRDGGTRFGGWDVEKALAGIRGEINKALIGQDATDQRSIDETLIALDGTPNKSRLGGNATVAVSMAVLRAAAAADGKPLWRYLADGRPIRLPLPEVQIFGGGAHAGRRVDIQDFLVMPVGARSFSEALEMVWRVYAQAGELLALKGPLTGVADEGGYWPNFDNNEEALTLLARAIEASGYRNGEVMISLDIAASEFHANGLYTLGLEGKTYDTGAWIDVLAGWISRFPIQSIEDPVGESDHDGMVEFTRRFGDKLQIIGDDYLVTSAQRVHAAQEAGACNAVLLKVNQCGTVTETLEAFEAAKEKGWGTIVSARSGETEDTFISDLSAGLDAGQLKVGSFTRSERMAKWNQILRMEDVLGDKAVFAGRSALPEAIR
ncbi:MAG TPA: phosphopyruvate hydratase [Ensifer sp.]|nr:phosphopyruvate hydratase [Ensifer sp.]